MAKSSKKKNRKLRRQVRKTLGALFMASAITVAAIPVQDVGAFTTTPDGMSAENEVLVAVESPNYKKASYADADLYTSSIPHIQERTGTVSYDKTEETVYTSGDGLFQFVYARANVNDADKVAIIVGYSPQGSLEGGSLTIPDKLDAYRKLNTNTSYGGYCLVSRNGEFLYYASEEQEKEDNKLVWIIKGHNNKTGEQARVLTGDSGLFYEGEILKYRDNLHEEDIDPEDPSKGKQQVYDVYEVEASMVTVYNPCDPDVISKWQNIPQSDLYYYENDNVDTEPKQAGNDTKYWKIEATVQYIGEETIKSVGNGVWELDGYVDSTGKGIFSGQSNITNLKIGSSMRGIGDYAFYNCVTLNSVSLDNGLTTIGNGAFAECRNLATFDINSNALIKVIGKDAFYNCQALRTFATPIGLEALGDCAFENCISLQEINLSGPSENTNMSLSKLGYHVFRGCSSLTKIEFPASLTSPKIEICTFKGCTSLQSIKINSLTADFVCTHSEDDKFPNCKGFDWEAFKTMLPETFYIEADGSAKVHDTTREQSVAFKYAGQELYEKVMYERDKSDTDQEYEKKSAKVIYQVNNQNELEHFQILDKAHPVEINIPETIGPYGISSLGAGSFANNCDVERVTIPASVTSIGSGAFKGCHNLEAIIFTDASTIQSDGIGSDAFKTQDASCLDKLEHEPHLYVVGAMVNENGEDTEVFKYAMRESSNINRGDQQMSWITFHSGWPTNLEVQYNYNPGTQTGEAQLVGYTRYEDIDGKNDDAGSREDEIRKWVESLPYVNALNKKEVDEYVTMVTNATTWWQNGQQGSQPTENEIALVYGTLDIVIPASVDSIKPGLFSGVDVEGKDSDSGGKVARTNPDTNLRSILINGVNTIDSYTFKGCTALRSADIIGSSYVDDYAFDECTGLNTVTLGANLTDTGKRPFRGCTSLTAINPLDDDFFYANGILFRNTGSGAEVVECLETRGKSVGTYTVEATELAGVTSVKEEAFAGCDGFGSVDLSQSTIDTVPEGCFKETKLNSVILPDTVKNIEKDSFKNCTIRVLTIPGTQSYIEKDAFGATDDETDDGTLLSHDAQKAKRTIQVECIEGTTMDRYAKEYSYMNPVYDKVFIEFNVYFWDYPNYPDTTQKDLFYKTKAKSGTDAVPPTETPAAKGGKVFNGWTDYTNISRDTDVYPRYGDDIYTVIFLCSACGEQLGETQYIEAGKSAKAPEPHDHTEDMGISFTGWTPDYHDISKDTTIFAGYSDSSSNMHTVTFYDEDGVTVIASYPVLDGATVYPPQPPVKSGYTFNGWKPSIFTNITRDSDFFASYIPSSGNGSGSGGNGSGGNGSGGNGSGGNGSNASASPSKSPSASPSASPEATPGVTKYTVSVSGGSGSGQYAAGEIVALNAYFMGSGQNFDKWTTSTAGVGFANANASSTTFTMPAANVAITATYTTGGGTPVANSSGGGSSSGGGNSGKSSGTSVQVDRPGISNEGLAGATVSGSTDNFIVKVTEDQNATNAVVAALQARYGDISRIKYLPMDISLYDSTGRTKIADTGGISVNLTLPIPDDLVQYAGNNKVAAITNGSMEDLNVRFTTVDGVSCVNFTATHFSPYVIYVDTANLTASTIDASPKTGDPIHPKWFLAMGMACISLILFFKRDKAIVKAKTV